MAEILSYGVEHQSDDPKSCPDYFTSIRLAVFPSFFGNVSSNVPFSYFASALASSTSLPSVKLL
jgi:hypothetical protein